MSCNPHLLIEGAIIAAYAMGIGTIYLYIRGEYNKWIAMVQKAVDEAYARGYFGENILGSGFSTSFTIHRGAGAYICGEESSLMNSIEGQRGYPRVKPPFPAQFGLWGCPTTINNVETIANVPVILRLGWEAYCKIGHPKHPGPILVGVSGHVNTPGVFELPTGVLLTDIIYKHAGGVPGNKKIKAVIPGGSSTMILRGEAIEGVTMDAEGLKAAGSSVGTAGMIVMDEDTDLIRVITRIAGFYHHESCGQCTPCREGTGWMHKILKRFEAGEATMADLDLLLEVANNIEGNTICALGDAAAWPVQSMIKRFREEFEKKVTSGGAGGRNDGSLRTLVRPRMSHPIRDITVEITRLSEFDPRCPAPVVRHGRFRGDGRLRLGGRRSCPESGEHRPRADRVCDRSSCRVRSPDQAEERTGGQARNRHHELARDDRFRLPGRSEGCSHEFRRE